MKKIVLVCYASRYGSTGEIAEVIAEQLETMEVSTEVARVEDVKSPAGFDAVVLGSPLYMGKMLPEAREFVHKFRGPLSGMPLYVFVAGYTFRERLEEYLRSGEDAIDAIRLYVTPLGTGYFAGRVDPDRVSGPDREILIMGGVHPGDFREWDRIKKWAVQIGEKILEM
ncbi:menaquinone-dependent protoporphyrinogen oxidase [Methanolinea mesophila]|uniref:flavodoxin domain-containing protein n=1 Tax=Methanolinea mesophila TaxID=547055 RepID=UPI001AEA2642|nr:flavodoxin domain-containing protein [Methanolinea mesophila]MBP1928592.1 menaquinone-dependent protoporphyrinogen oxidase [Methanolinea mesophila]